MEVIIKLIPSPGRWACEGCIFNSGEGNCAEMSDELKDFDCVGKIWVVTQIKEIQT